MSIRIVNNWLRSRSVGTRVNTNMGRTLLVEASCDHRANLPPHEKQEAGSYARSTTESADLTRSPSDPPEAKGSLVIAGSEHDVSETKNRTAALSLIEVRKDLPPFPRTRDTNDLRQTYVDWRGWGQWSADIVEYCTSTPRDT